jgi:hypothetical protein
MTSATTIQSYSPITDGIKPTGPALHDVYIDGQRIGQDLDACAALNLYCARRSLPVPGIPIRREARLMIR